MAFVSYSLFDLLQVRGEEEVSKVLSSFCCARNKDIEELMAFVEQSIAAVQHLVGGRFVFLDAVNERGLIEFYSRMGYREFGMRDKPAGEDSDSVEGSYIQMFKYLHLS